MTRSETISRVVSEQRSDNYYTVGTQGAPDPDEHPWVMLTWPGATWRLVDNASVPGRPWKDHEQWFPVSAPPSSPAPDPEPEGVEVDGKRWRLSSSGGMIEVLQNASTTHESWWSWMSAGAAVRGGRVAAALGLVDQPAVPQSLINELQRWVDDKFCDPNVRYAVTNLLGRARAGEFGPAGWEWVTDRLPEDHEYPVLCCERSTYDVVYLDSDYLVEHGERWVSLSALGVTA